MADRVERTAEGFRPRSVRLARWVRAASIAAGVAALVILLRALPSTQALHAVIDWMDGLGWTAPIVFVTVYFVATILMLPAWPLSAAAGMLFGLAWGTLAVFIGAVAGMTAAFLIARYAARETVARKIRQSPKFAAVDRAVGRDGWKIVALLRLSPAVPFNVQNYLYGLTAIRFWPCIIASAIAILPGTFMYVYLGHAGRAGLAAAGGAGAERGMAQWALLVIGLMATVAVTIYITRLARRAIAEQAPLEDAPEISRLSAAAVNAANSWSGDSKHAQSIELQNGQFSAALEPMDTSNQQLRRHAHPTDWQNPTPSGRYNLVVIGAGPAGLVAAAGAAGLGAKVALIERSLMGGDCLNLGCVPSKALIRAARAMADVRDARRFGVAASCEPEATFGDVMQRVRHIRAELSAHDSVARFASLGIDVFLGEARFLSPRTIEVNGQSIQFVNALIATGARAVPPPIEGIEKAGFLTNETVFSLTELPARLAVVGAGPIGCEMAQAFARLGSKVTLVEALDRILPRDDPDAARVVEAALKRDGVNLVCGGKTLSVHRDGAEKVLRLVCDGAEHEFHVNALLAAVGRTPNVEALHLDAAGIKYDTRRGVHVDGRLRTTNPRVYAAGDVASGYRFTHAADAMARIVLQNALFFGRAKAGALTIPWCTYTDPEVAHVGMTEAELARQRIAADTLTVHLTEVDRAVLDGEHEGFLRLHLKKGSDRILGATLVARHAGDIISEITAVMAAGKGLRALANTIHPYPTQAEVVRKAADAYNRTRLTPTVSKLFKAFLAWRRRAS